MSPEKEKQNEINILDTLVILARHKMFIIKLVFTITLISLIISLVWPHTYRSTSTFLPVSPQRSLPGGLSGLLGGSIQSPMSFPQVNPEVFITILNSRELREALIHEFNFQEIYNTDLMEELLLKLDEDVEIEEQREGGFGFNPIYSIKLSFYSNEPELSYEVNRYILSSLDRKIREINHENSMEFLQILETRYQRNLETLEASEDSLQAFQERYGILEVEEQARQIVRQLADLKAGSIETEMHIAVLRQSVSDENVELRNLIRTREEYDRQFRNLMDQSDQQTADITGFYPLRDMPELGIAYFRLFRDVEIQAEVLKTIYPQYESQKMIVEANQRGIQIIDQPVIPTYKDSPKRAFIVLGGMFFSIFLALTIVFFREMLEQGRKNNSENYRKLQELFEHLKIRRANKAGSSDES
ncbi:MAG: GNVR domain-containing protein [Balneolales bacterium]